MSQLRESFPIYEKIVIMNSEGVRSRLKRGEKELHSGEERLRKSCMVLSMEGMASDDLLSV